MKKELAELFPIETDRVVPLPLAAAPDAALRLSQATIEQLVPLILRIASAYTTRQPPGSFSSRLPIAFLYKSGQL